jgi:NADH:ubiquinone oxidoreductase subunit C
MSEDAEALGSKLGVTIENLANSKIIPVEPSRVKEACRAVSSLPGLYHLSTIAATDRTDRIEISYFFWRGRSFFIVRTSVPKPEPRLDSVSDVLPGATLYEAEIQDLFGVSFTGSPYAGKRLLLPDSYPPGAPPPFTTEADPEKIRKMMNLD